MQQKNAAIYPHKIETILPQMKGILKVFAEKYCSTEELWHKILQFKEGNQK